MSSSRTSALSESRSSSLNRQILALAVPAFGALVAEPLFVLGDTAIVGHLGTEPLAGADSGGNRYSNGCGNHGLSLLLHDPCGGASFWGG